MSEVQNFEPDPKYTLNALPHWAEVTQTQKRRSALPSSGGHFIWKQQGQLPFKVPDACQAGRDLQG